MAKVQVTAADGTAVFEGDLDVVPRTGELLRRGDEVRRVESVVWTLEGGAATLTATVRLEDSEYRY